MGATGLGENGFDIIQTSQRMKSTDVWMAVDNGQVFFSALQILLHSACEDLYSFCMQKAKLDVCSTLLTVAEDTTLQFQKDSIMLIVLSPVVYFSSHSSV